MRSLLFLVFLGVMPTFGFGSDAHAEQRIEAKLMRESVVNIAPAKETTYEDFVGDWGQFEVRAPKARFPIPAPHCRSNVILRMPGVAPDVPDREGKLAFNWRQFQSLYALQSGELDQLDIKIASGPYMRINKQGERELQYCNAYMEGASLPN